MKLSIMRLSSSFSYFLLGSNIFLSTLFTNIPQPVFFPTVRDQVLHPYKTIGTIIVVLLVVLFLNPERKNCRCWTESQLWRHPYVPTKANGSVPNNGTIQQHDLQCDFTGKGKVVSCLYREGIWVGRAVAPLVLASAHCLGVASEGFQRLRRLHNHWPCSGYYDMTLLVFCAWFLSGSLFLLLNSP